MLRAADAAAADADAVRRFVADGCEESFRHLYRSHSPFLFALALRLAAGRREQAEEVLQESWIRASSRLHGFRGDSKLRTWLAGFVVHCSREAARRGRRQRLAQAPVGEEGGDGDRGATVASATGNPSPALRLDLEATLGRLSAVQREVLLLHDLHGFTHTEIGALVDVPVGTSKRRLFDARRALRRLLTAGGSPHTSGAPHD